MSSPYFINPRANPELKCLYEIALIPYQEKFQDYFLAVTGKIADYFPVTYSALFLHDPRNGDLLLEALVGMDKAEHPLHCNPRTGVIGEVLASRLPRVIQQLEEEPLYQDWNSVGKKTGKISAPLPCAPILVNQHPVGVLTLNPLYGPREDLAEDLQFLFMLTCILSPVIRELLAGKNRPLAKTENPKLKFSLIEETLETRLNEVLERMAPYAESKAHAGMYGDIIGIVERILITSALEKADHVQVTAAQLLGINRNTLRKKMKDFKIKGR